MKLFTLIILVLTAVNYSSAQIDWLFLQGDDNDDTGDGIVIDSKDYIYVCGTFEGSVDFDPTNTNQIEQSNSAFFLQKLDLNENLIWVKVFHGSGEIHDMHIDDNDNIYLVGSFTGSAFWMSSSNSSDGFVVKFDEDGNIIWSKSIRGNDIQRINGMALDNDNNIYLTGHYRGETDLDPSINQDLHAYNASFQGYNAFITKWSNNGDYIWGKSAQSSDRSGIDVIVDSEFNVYDVGSKLQFNHYVHYINKMDSSGNQLWNKSGNGNYNGAISFSTHASCLAVDQNDRLFIGGMFAGEIDLGYGDTTLEFSSNSNSSDAFVQCLQPNGDVNWIRTFGNVGIDDVRDLKISLDGNLYLTGSFTDSVEFNIGVPSSLSVSQSIDLYIMSWNSLDGSFNWAETFGGTCDYSRARALAFSNQGDVYGTGIYTGSVEDGNGTYYAIGHGEDDCIVYKVGGTTVIDEMYVGGINICPNPTRSKIYIEGLDDYHVDIYSFTGELLKSFPKSQGNTIDLTFLSKGTYVLKLTNNDLLISKIFVKN